MEALIAFILALIMLLTGCGRTRAEVIPEAPKTETAIEAEPQETIFVPVTAEERLAYAFADMAATEALEGAEDLVFEGTLNGSPLFYSQEESLNFSALGSSDVTYYREIGYRSGVGDEEVSGHYTVNYDGNSLVSLFDSGKKNTQKASPDALSKNIRASLTAFLDRDAALGYTVLGQEENGSELTISFTADEERIYDLFDRSLTLMGEGFGEDLSGSVYGATERNGGAPVCMAVLDGESFELLRLTLDMGNQAFTLEDGSLLEGRVCYELRVSARGEDVVPFIPGFS